MLTVVQHDPRRAALLSALVARLPGPVHVHVDAQRGGLEQSWPRYRRALLECPADGHVLVVQDDAVVADGFAPTVESICRAGAGASGPTCLFAGRNGDQCINATGLARAQGAAYAPLQPHPWVPLVCTLWPAWAAVSCASYPAAPGVADDAHVGAWCREMGVQPWVSYPSLAEHPEDVPSLMGGSWHPRVACHFEPVARPASWWLGPICV